MNTKQTLLVLALSSVLVACGSSSSQGTSTPSVPNSDTTQKDKTDSANSGIGQTDSQGNSPSGKNNKKEINDSIYEADRVTTQGDFDCFGYHSDCSEDGLDGGLFGFFENASQEDISRLMIGGEIINLRPFDNVQEENYYYKDVRHQGYLDFLH